MDGPLKRLVSEPAVSDSSSDAERHSIGKQVSGGRHPVQRQLFKQVRDKRCFIFALQVIYKAMKEVLCRPALIYVFSKGSNLSYL